MTSTGDQEQLLQDVYDRFRASGEWPLVRDLQVAHKALGNIRYMAATIGVDRMVCEEGQDGRCFLRLGEVNQRAHSHDDISAYLATLRFIAAAFEAHGPSPVTSEQLASALALEPLALKRLSRLLCRDSGPWSGGSWDTQGVTFSVTPVEEALFYDSVHTFPQYQAARNQYIEQSVATSRLINAGLYRGLSASAPVAKAPPSPPPLADPALRNLLERDMAELEAVLRVHAWKAAVILAGSCLEAILLDIWKRRESEAMQRFGKEWPNRVDAFQLAEAALAAGYISKDHASVASLIRRWRNMIHPVAAIAAAEFSEELAHALAAILRWILADLSRQDV